MRRLSRISRSNLELPDVSIVKSESEIHQGTSGNSDFTKLTSDNSKFDLEMRESLLISKLKPILNDNIPSMPLYLF